MATVPKSKAVIEYNGKNITEDLTDSLLSLTYTDHVKGKSDEFELSFEDVEAKWRNEWYPEKGDKISVKIGYEDNLVSCGEFVVDEVELQGPPDTVSIRSMAASVKNSLRTKKSKAHENKTLKDIAQATASSLGLTLKAGDGLDKIRVTRSTQNRQTDLEYLRGLVEKYGWSFSVRGTTMHIFNLEELEKSSAVTVIRRSDLISYSFTDKATKVYKNAEVSYHDPKTNEVIKGEHTPPNINYGQGDLLIYKPVTSDDTLKIKTKVENKTQADAIAKAAIHQHNSRTQTGRITVVGNPSLVAGSNFDLFEMGKLSGKYHIESSTHRIDRSSGYTCDLEIKRVEVSVKKADTKAKVANFEPKPRTDNINYFRGDLLIYRPNS